MPRIGYSAVFLSVLLALTACAQQAQSTNASAPDGSNPNAARQVKGVGGIDGEVVGTAAPGSKFSRIQIGMGKKEVEDIIGPPSDSSTHITGKSFIPFFFGGDTQRIEAHYKNEGILTYSPRSFGNTSYVLIGITIDRTERGYAA